MPQQFGIDWSCQPVFTVGGVGGIHGDNSSYIKRHDYVPSKFNMYKTDFEINDTPNLYMGFELEVDYGGKTAKNAKIIYDILGENHAYCSHDGSLNNGFEIVTHPMTLAYHKTMPYMDIMDKLVALKYKSHNTTTCGLHVHFNRNFFGDTKIEQDLCIVKLLYIFEKFESEIQTVSRRSNSRYAGFVKSNDNESAVDLYVKARQSGKYCSINLQHKDTIEIRTFKGTLKYETLINTLTFVESIARLTKNADIYKLNELNWKMLLNICGDDFTNYYLERVEIDKKSKVNTAQTRPPAYPYVAPAFAQRYEGDIDTLEVDARTDIDNLKIVIKSLKRELKYAVGMRKGQIQRELQEKQRELNRLS